MNKAEFKAIVDDAVKNGADRKEAEAYVRAGYRINEDAEGQEKLGTTAEPIKKAKGKSKK